MLRTLMALFAVSLVLTHLPAAYVPDFGRGFPLFASADKSIHFALYLALGAWLTLALDSARGRRSPRSAATWPTPLVAIGAWLLLAGYGLLDEATQPWVGRQLDMADWAADMAGAAVGALAAATVAVHGGLLAERMAMARLSLAPVRAWGTATRLPLRRRLLLRRLRRLGGAG